MMTVIIYRFCQHEQSSTNLQRLIGFLSLFLQWCSDGLVLYNSYTGSLWVRHSITPLFAVFSVTDGRVPAKLFVSKWMFSVQYTTRRAACLLNQENHIAVRHSGVLYLTHLAIGIFQEDGHIHQLPIFCSLDYK